jgi:hypothetical protein
MVKSVVVVKLPPAVVRLILPVTEPGITIATTCVAVPDTTMAVTPPIRKEVGVSRSVPVMVTRLPAEPEAGVKELIMGSWAYNPREHTEQNSSKQQVRIPVLPLLLTTRQIVIRPSPGNCVHDTGFIVQQV